MILVHCLFKIVHVIFAISRGQRTFYCTTLEKPRTVGSEHWNIKASIQQHLTNGCTILTMSFKGDILTLINI